MPTPAGRPEKRAEAQRQPTTKWGPPSSPPGRRRPTPAEILRNPADPRNRLPPSLPAAPRATGSDRDDSEPQHESQAPLLGLGRSSSVASPEGPASQGTAPSPPPALPRPPAA